MHNVRKEEEATARKEVRKQHPRGETIITRVFRKICLLERYLQFVYICNRPRREPRKPGWEAGQGDSVPRSRQSAPTAKRCGRVLRHERGAFICPLAGCPVASACPFSRYEGFPAPLASITSPHACGSRCSIVSSLRVQNTTTRPKFCIIEVKLEEKTRFAIPCTVIFGRLGIAPVFPLLPGFN